VLYKEEQEFVMTAVEALRLKLDNLRKEKQELEVRLLKYTQAQPDAVAAVEVEQERDHWKEKYEGVVSENSQLRRLYEELLKYKSQENSGGDLERRQQVITELQEQLKQEEVSVQQWKDKCEKFSCEISEWKSQCMMLETEVGKLKERCQELEGKLESVEATMELELKPR